MAVSSSRLSEAAQSVFQGLCRSYSLAYSIFKAGVNNYLGKIAWVSWFTSFFPLQILKFHFLNCKKLMLQRWVSQGHNCSLLTRLELARSTESTGEEEALMQGIPLTFRSAGQNSASSARSLRESNSSAGSKETGFVFQTSSYSSGSETLSH